MVGAEFLSEDSLQSLTLLEPQIVGLGDTCRKFTNYQCTIPLNNKLNRLTFMLRTKYVAT